MISCDSSAHLVQCLDRLAAQTHNDFESIIVDNGSYKTQELIRASSRELLNGANWRHDEIGCHVITVTHDILKKLSLVGKELDEYSLDTVKMFHEDAQKAGYQL